MSDKPTAQQVRDAMEVITALKLSGAGDWVMKGLANAAERLEREIVIRGLVTELKQVMPEVQLGDPAWHSIARHLTQLHPCLLDEPTR